MPEDDDDDMGIITTVLGSIIGGLILMGVVAYISYVIYAMWLAHKMDVGHPSETRRRSNQQINQIISLQTFDLAHPSAARRRSDLLFELPVTESESLNDQGELKVVAADNILAGQPISFCGVCGTAVCGTAFCTGCGAPAEGVSP